MKDVAPDARSVSRREIGPRPSPAVAGVSAYGVPRASMPIDLRLDGNEGCGPGPALLEAAARLNPEVLRRYPDPRPLEAQLARCLGVSPEQVIATAGADDALDRACRALLAPGRELVLPEPTFEMFPRYAALTSATLISVPWPEGEWPVAAIQRAITPATAAIAAVSPNNPTGAVIAREALAEAARAAPHAAMLVDLAYAEFADDDLTSFALTLPNAIVFRTFSKAWGLAGLRVGYAIGPERIIGWMRAAAGPYTVSNLSLALAAQRLAQGDECWRPYVARAREERTELARVLRGLGARAAPSQGNFVLARVRDPLALRDGLAARGIGVRVWPGRPLLDDAVRITVPGNERDFARLVGALEELMAKNEQTASPDKGLGIRG